MKNFVKWTLGLVVFLVVLGGFFFGILKGGFWLLAQWKESAFPLVILAMLFSAGKIYLPAKRVYLTKMARIQRDSDTNRRDTLFLCFTALVLVTSYFWIIPGYVGLVAWLLIDTATDLPLIFGRESKRTKSTQDVPGLGDDIFAVIGPIFCYVKDKLSKYRII